jgi:uncharacterized RDD family membrane protein YckC
VAASITECRKWKQHTKHLAPAGSCPATQTQTCYKNMTWYYVESGQQRGPVSEGELQGLVQSGVVRDDTMVWREGMANWQAYREAAASPGPSLGTPALVARSVVCSQCGKAFASDEVIQIGDAQVCAACKPVFLQRMQEGAAPHGSHAALHYAGFWIRGLALLIDTIIVGVVGTIIEIAVGAMLAAGGETALIMAQIISTVLAFALGLSYVTWFLGRFGATPGKMVLGLRVVTPEGGKISYWRAFGRYWAEILSGLLCAIGYIMAAFDDEKRALHDRICTTRVVRT